MSTCWKPAARRPGRSTTDGVHQNDLGHRLVANRIFEVLAQSCSCLAKKTREAERHSPRWRDESTLQSDYGH